MKTTKLTRTLLAGMMTCTMALTAVSVTAFATPSVTQAAVTKGTGDFNLNLHKFKVLDGREFDHTGEVTNTDGLTGLNGVQFDVFNVTALFHQIKEAQDGWTNKQVIEHMQSNWKGLSGNLQALKTITTGQTADGKDGIASTTLPKTTKLGNNDVNSIFMFVEKGTPGNQYVQSPPFALGMNKALADKGTVDLYAKNYSIQKDLLGDNELPLPDGYYSYDVGQELSYVSTTPIPAGITRAEEGYKRLSFVDEMDQKGTTLTKLDVGYEGEDGWVSVKDKFDALGNPLSSMTDMDAWQAADHKFAGFSYELDIENVSEENAAAMDQLLTDIAGKQLKFKYTMVINDEAEPYVEIGNEFVGNFTNKYGDSETKDTAPEVEFGAHKFKKVDADNHEQGLEDAEFVIRKVENGETKYAKFNEDDANSSKGNYHPDTITWETDKNKATTLISGEKGMIYVYGLEAGSYVLEETKAPTGYTMSQSDHEFTVNTAEEGADRDDEGQVIIGSKTIENIPTDEILPITGGVGIVTFLVLGAMTMGGAAYYKKKKA